jgi:hypothetical protein
VRILITSSRMPFALDEIRKLGRAGHTVFASDTFRTAPGSHSKYVAEHRITASPRFATGAFLDDISRFVRERDIDLVLPAFEETFHLANHKSFLASADLFASDHDVMLDLHDKARFMRLAERLELGTPRTILAETQQELGAAIRELGSYFGRAAYSRGGIQLLTNTGPLAGVVPIETCNPSVDNPWLLQEFVEGPDVCTFSICHHGRVTGHSTYLHPREIEHAGGIVFQSIEDPETLEATQRIVEAVGYHGQLSLDFKRTPRGLVLIECNPRPTAGVIVMPDAMFLQALLDPGDGPPLVAPAGGTRKFTMALLRDMVLHPAEAREDLRYLLSNAREFYLDRDDPVPGLWQVLSYSHVADYRRFVGKKRDKRTDLMAAYFYDILYDGRADAHASFAA